MVAGWPEEPGEPGEKPRQTRGNPTKQSPHLDVQPVTFLLHVDGVKTQRLA